MCYISIINIQGQNDSDSDDEMAFTSGFNKSNSSDGPGFQKIAVKRDAETGEITGWQDFYQMARLQNPDFFDEE